MAASLSRLILSFLLLSSTPLFSCPTCMSAGGEAVKGLFWSMLALFLTVLFVLCGLAGYFLFLKNQATAHAAKESSLYLNKREGE
ncbi:MAG: hypothetical protein AB8C84_02130 [Oligoflexales bacterium]